MTKFGQAEFAEYLAEIFTKNKLDKMLETEEKQNFSSKNTEDIYKECKIIFEKEFIYV